MSEESDYVTLNRGTAFKDGGCNACSRYTTAAGIADHPVTEIHLRRCSFRLCDDCLQELKRKLCLQDGKMLKELVKKVIDSGAKITIDGGAAILQ